MTQLQSGLYIPSSYESAYFAGEELRRMNQEEFEQEIPLEAAISSTPVNQGTGVWASGSTVPVTIPAPTSGNILIACYASSTKTVSVSSITCTNVTWNVAATITSGTNQRSEIWFGIVGASAGTSVTINLSGAPTNGYSNISEWSGINILGSEKDNNSCQANSGSSLNLTSAVVTPTNSSTNILFIGGGRHAGSLNPAGNIAGDGTSAASWTNLTQPNAAALFSYTVAVSTSGTYGFHSIWNSNNVFDCTIAGFIAAAGGGFTAVNRRTLGMKVGSRG